MSDQECREYSQRVGERLLDDPLHYADENLGIEFRIGDDLEYRSVCITVTCGGPGCYIDTATNRVETYWGASEGFYGLPSEVVDRIDEFYEQEYRDLMACKGARL